MAQLILVLNPGSTSTKAAVYEDERPLLSCSIAHTNQEFTFTLIRMVLLIHLEC